MTLVPASSHGSTFNGGTVTSPLEVDVTAATDALIATADAGNARLFWGSTGLNLAVLSAADSPKVLIDAHNGREISLDPYGGSSFDLAAGGNITLVVQGRGGASDLVMRVLDSSFNVLQEITNGGVTSFPTGGIAANPIASGALPTVAPVSGTAFQCSTTRDVFLTVPVTYNPGVATTATCKVELSPNNVTFSELVTVTQPVGTVFDGSIEAVQLVVPAAWRVKLTVVNATLGTATYY